MEIWPDCGYTDLSVSESGYLVPSASYWRLLLQRPELAPIEESGPAERALHARLLANPNLKVSPQELNAVEDPDTQENYRQFLRFRQGLQAASSLEAYYLALMRSAQIDIAPAFIDLMVQAIVRHVLGDSPDAIHARAGELLFRKQRVSMTDGRILAGDREALDAMQATGGLGDLGRLLMQNQVRLSEQALQVLGSSNQQRYLQDAANARYRFQWLLDLTLETQSSVGEGQHRWDIVLANKHSGVKALASMLELWAQHMLGVPLRITPLAKVEDSAWRWHTGLDATSSSLLNDLYAGTPVEPERMAQLLSLFRIDFLQAGDMRADLAGKPVYAGIAMTEAGLLRVKPQNLLLNLPLAQTVAAAS
jgi:Family of unknown function (DUF6352)